MPDSLGVDELRRRVQKDPASIAFAQLAEELRKAGHYDEAARVCRTGLERHPTYLAGHVTLGRALVGLQQFADARTELEYVLRAAPDNLLAQKGMSELQERAGVAAAPAPTEALGAEALTEPADPHVSEEHVANPTLGELEQWQARIEADRARQSGERHQA
jgi:predicted Zn-dependent protease